MFHWRLKLLTNHRDSSMNETNHALTFSTASLLAIKELVNIIRYSEESTPILNSELLRSTTNLNQQSR